MGAQSDELLRRIYDAFNAREIDRVLTALHPNVEWPNGMTGGYVHGREAVRTYWTNQWQQIDPHVEPTSIARDRSGRKAIALTTLPASPACLQARSPSATLRPGPPPRSAQTEETGSSGARLQPRRQ